MRILDLLLFCSLPACAVDAAAPAPTCASDAPSNACLGIGPDGPADDAPSAPRSVLGTPLATCSTSPMTGFFRDGTCRTGPEDRGVHVVCAEVDADFLAYTARQGNDLSTPRPHLGFAGLQPGDRWCLCAARWEEARLANVAPPVVLKATHATATRFTSRTALDTHAAPAQTP